MWREYMQRALHWMGLVIRQPQHELDRWQRAARFSYDLGRYGTRQLREDRAPQMAAALAFQTLFALVPVLIVVMVIVQAFTNWQSFVATVNTMLDSAGLSDVSVTLSSTNPDGTPQIESLQSWLVGLIRQAADVDLSVVGWVGFVVIVYAGISMLTTIENSFNIIYRAPQGRPWSRRVPLYWFLITVSPLAIASEAWVHGQVVESAADLISGDWFGRLVGIGWSICIGWLFWFAVYSLVPNTLVNLRSTAIGAFVCVLLLEIAKQSLGGYLSNAFTVSRFYGSLGLIPLFMFWVYLMWLFVLFGLEVAATLQFLGDRALEEIETRREFAGLVEPAAVITVMEVVAEDFRSGQPTPQRRISDRTGVPERIVQSIVQELMAAGLLHRVERDQTAVCLALPPDEVTADRLIDIGFRLADHSGEREISHFAERLREQQRALAGSVTLASLLPAR